MRVFLPAASCILSKCIRYVTGIKLLDTKVLESQRHGTNQCVRLLAVKRGMRKLRSAGATERQRKLKPITIVPLWKIADRQARCKCVEEKCHSPPVRHDRCDNRDCNEGIRDGNETDPILRRFFCREAGDFE